MHNAEPEDRIRSDDQAGGDGVGTEAHAVDPATHSAIPELKFDHSIGMMASRFAHYYHQAKDKQYALAQLVTNLRLVHPAHHEQVLQALPPEMQKELSEQALRMAGEQGALKLFRK